MAKASSSIAHYLARRFFLLISILTFFLGLAWFIHLLWHFDAYAKHAEKDSIERTRRMLKTRVDAAVAHIDVCRKQMKVRAAEQGEAFSERACQQHAVEWLESIQFGDGGYVFAGDWNGVSTSGPGKGRNMLDVRDANGVAVVEELIALSKQQNGGWLTYVMPPVDGQRSAPKMSYVRGIPGWNWFIGAGVYLDEVNASVEAEKDRWRAIFPQLVLLMLGVLLLALAGSAWFARRIAIRFGNDFQVFNRFFRDAGDTPVTVNPELLRLKELRETAGLANQMVERRKQAERELRESEERLRTLMDAAPDAFILHDAKGQILQINEAGSRILGYTRDELLKMNVMDIDATFSRPKQEELGQKLEKQRTVSLERRYQRKDGSVFPAEVRVTSLNLHGQRVIFGFIRDISQRRKAEEAIRESEARYRTLFESARDAIFLMRDGVFIDGNERVLAFFGCTSRDQFIGRTPFEFSPPKQPDGSDSHEKGAAKMAALMAGESQRFEWLHRRMDGTLFPAEVNLNTVELNGVTHAQAIARDISERRGAEEEKAKLEDQLRHAQRMEAIGQLAGGIAHDFNNLLQVINGRAEILQLRVPAGTPWRDDIQHIAEAGERSARLVSQLLAFSRRQVMRLRNLDLNEVVGGLLRMVGRVIGEDIRLDFAPGHQLGLVRGDLGMIEQILMNLCVNARDAMSEGGSLSIETENVELGTAYCRTHPWAKPGPFVKLSVKDTGCGMSKETQDRIFEPFFTTKQPGKGTGLGLAMVYGLVKQHDGYIDCESEVGRGTTFNIYLPLCTEDVQEEDAEKEGETPGGTETILLAEDDENVRNLASQILGMAGYNVLTARDGVEATELFSSNATDVHLLLLDVVMPRMGGRDVYEMSRKLRPDIPALFTSGYNADVIHTDFVLDKGISLLQKPFTRGDLLRAVREALEKQP